MPLPWGPLSLDDKAWIQFKMERIFKGWVGTPYGSGQRCRGVAADCIGFGFSALDELDGRPRAQNGTLPPDAALHDRRGASRAVAALRRLYAPVERLRLSGATGTCHLEPGDILVVGAAQGGPAHLMLVGPRPNTIWHCSNGVGVHQAGWMLGDGYDRVILNSTQDAAAPERSEEHTSESH